MQTEQGNMNSNTNILHNKTMLLLMFYQNS